MAVADRVSQPAVEERRAALRFLAGASRLLAEPLSVAATLRGLARLAVPTLADLCLIYGPGPGGGLSVLALAHGQPELEERWWDAEQRVAALPGTRPSVDRVLRSGQSVLAPDLTEERAEAAVGDPEYLALVRPLLPLSYICVPLASHGRVLGALTLCAARGSRHYEAADLRAAEDIGRLVAVALYQARLAREADTRARESAGLYQAARAIGRAQGLEQRLERVLDTTVGLLGVRYAHLALLDPVSGEITIVAARGADEQAVGRRVASGEGLLGTVLKVNRPVRCGDMLADPRTQHRDVVDALGLRSWLGVPLLDEDGAIGALSILSQKPDAFTEQDERTLTALAALAASAVREARLRERLERELARRRHVEATLRERERELRAVVETASVVLFALDRDGVVTLAEGRPLANLGVRPDAVVGRSAFELFPAAPEVAVNVRRALAGDAFSCIATIQGRVFEVRYEPVRDPDGSVAGVTGVAADVTEREGQRRRLEGLVRSARRLGAEGAPAALLRELTDEAVALVGGGEGSVFRWDAAPGVLIKVASSSGGPTRGAPALKPGQGAAGRAVARLGPVVIDEYALECAGEYTGAPPNIHAALAVPLLHEGQLLGAISILHPQPARFSPEDAQALEVLAAGAAAQLVGLERARLEGALLAARTAGHHVNNALTLTVGYTELLSRHPGLPADLRDWVQEAHRGAQRAASAVARLQRVARLAECTDLASLDDVNGLLDLDRSVAG